MCRRGYIPGFAKVVALVPTSPDVALAKSGAFFPPLKLNYQPNLHFLATGGFCRASIGEPRICLEYGWWREAESGCGQPLSQHTTKHPSLALSWRRGAEDLLTALVALFVSTLCDRELCAQKLLLQASAPRDPLGTCELFAPTRE
jgi:hypothetical protein